MPTTKRTEPPPEHPPGRDALYGHILDYWMTRLGLSDQHVANAIRRNRTYPGKIRQCKRVPSPHIANAIRGHLLKTAKAPGPYGPPPLTESERNVMDELLRASFAREDQARRAKRRADGVAEEDEADDDKGEGTKAEAGAEAANAGSDVVTALQAEAPPRRRASLSPLATVGLIALALALTFGGVVYYATHASSTPPPRPSNSAGRAYTPQQLYRAVSTSRPVVHDALTAPDANGWDEGPMPGGDCQYKAGAYHATVLRPAVIQCFPETAPPLPSSGILAVQVDLTFLNGDGGGGVVLCYAGLKTPYYRFVVRPDGYFDLYDPVTRVGVSPAVLVPPSAQYRVTAIVRAIGIYFYINGVFMVSSPVEPGVAFDGQVGVFSVDGKHNPTDAAFHNFTVWSLT